MPDAALSATAIETTSVTLSAPPESAVARRAAVSTTPSVDCAAPRSRARSTTDCTRSSPPNTPISEIATSMPGNTDSIA